MSAIPDGTAASSWMQRALAENVPQRQQGGSSGDPVNPPPRGSGEGWDPYEVWLSRIERPRRLRVSCPIA